MHLKISVIIPIYNVEKYLEDCLVSVINQDIQDIEIICINDCSTDDSIEILRRYMKKDSRIVLINNDKNEGQSYSRNRGMDNAKGEYIYFLDSDDILRKDALRELYIIAQENDLDGVFFDSLPLYESKELREKFPGNTWAHKNCYSSIYEGKQLYCQFVKNKELLSAVCLQFWRRKFLNDHTLRFFDGIVHEDILFTFLSMMGAKRVKYVPEYFYYYRHRANSTTTIPISKQHIKGLFRCYFEILKYWIKEPLDQELSCCIEMQLETLCNSAKNMYRKIVPPVLPEEIDRYDFCIQHLFKAIIINSFEDRAELEKKITKEQISEIMSFKNVIIYGAGRKARDFLEVLDKNKISILSFAVSNIEDNCKSIMGNGVAAIDSLLEYSNDSVVIIATLPKYHLDIKNNLKRLGFKNIITLS